MLRQRREVLVVAGAVLERDVEVADFLAEREVVRAVHREREHRRLVAEDRRGAVALVDVAVDDRGARDGAVAQQHAGGDRDVVEHAVALAAIAEGVVRAAGEVGRHARLAALRSVRADELRAPPRASRRPSVATARPSSATTESRSAAAPRRTACRSRRRRRTPASWTSRRSSQRIALGDLQIVRRAGCPRRGAARAAASTSPSETDGARAAAGRRCRSRTLSSTAVRCYSSIACSRIKTIDAHAAGEPLRLDRRRLSVAARQDDAREARVGAEARGSSAARADAGAARPRRHVRRDPHRAGDARTRTPACCSCTTKAGARCAATASSR